jgi:hypothetical protein
MEKSVSISRRIGGPSKSGSTVLGGVHETLREIGSEDRMHDVGPMETSPTPTVALGPSPTTRSITCTGWKILIWTDHCSESNK